MYPGPLLEHPHLWQPGGDRLDLRVKLKSVGNLVLALLGFQI